MDVKSPWNSSTLLAQHTLASSARSTAILSGQRGRRLRNVFFFEMLARLATNPSRNVSALDFDVQPEPAVKRSDVGVKAQSFDLTLRPC